MLIQISGITYFVEKGNMAGLFWNIPFNKNHSV